MASRRMDRIAHFLIAGVAIGIVSLSPQANAINLVMNFQSGSSDFPAFDPDGSKLIALFDYAESFYQGVFQDSHTLTIDFRYDIIGDNAIGKHSLDSQVGVFNSSSDYRENSGNIRIDPGVNWFVDTTPADHSEFNMQQTLWRDLSTNDQDDWYNHHSAATPATFEVGYTGSAVSGSGAGGKLDMLSVVLHEVGHALGMASGNYGTQHETDIVTLNPWRGENDGDYDFSSSWTGGGSLAVEVANDSGDDNENIAHLENTFSLMTPSIPGSTRRLPSHTDLMAMAVGQNYSSLDIPRREFYATGGSIDWNDPLNWTGTEAPESGDDAYVRAAQGTGVSLRAGLTADGDAANLYVSEGSIADTNNFKLDVAGTASVSGSGSNIYINEGGELEAATAIINDGGQIRMTGGTLDVNTLDINAGGSLEVDQQGNATIDVSTSLVNDGLIDTDLTNNLPATFTFVTSNSGSVWDLDGDDGDGHVRANDGNISFNSGNMTDSFDGIIEVGSGYVFHFQNAWQNSSGLLDLNGGSSPANAASITGGNINMTGGELNADDSGTSFAQVGANLTVTAGTIVVGLDDTLMLTGSTTLGGTLDLNSAAKVQVDGTASFAGTTNYNATGSSALLELNGPVAWGNGRLNLNDSAATLAVNTPSGEAWEMSGTLRLTGNAAGANPIPAPLQGSDVTLSGKLEVVQHVEIVVATEVTATGTIELASVNDRLQLASDSVFRSGANINGNGTIHNMEGATLTTERGTTLGIIENSGTFEFAELTGTVTTGDFTQHDTGSIHFTLGGTDRLTEYSALTVLGTGSIDGTATVEFVDSGTGTYTPEGGDQFLLLSASNGLSGQFDELQLPDLESAWWQVSQGTRSISLLVVEPLLGDVNLDGQLTTGSGNPLNDDVAAFIAGWKTLLPTDFDESAWRKGDLNLDGVSDLADAFLLHSALTNANLSSAVFDSITVPEPNTFILFLMGATAFGLRARR